jgi:hypothetical protein
LPGLCDPPSYGGSNKERWLQLAELAAKEQNPAKLIELVDEINRVLQEKEQLLKAVRGDPSSSRIPPGAPTD